MIKKLIPLGLAAFVISSCAITPQKSTRLNSISNNAVSFYPKEVTFPPHATADQKIKMAAHVVPTPQQYQWQQLELTAFIHFGMNTFTDREWGNGKEDPKLFNPTDFDAEQWVKTLKAAGFKMLILTAKHHDGFCLWPTKTTKHSVASSPWKNGNGDVVKEVKAACDKYGLKFGVYLSPWDRNAPSYGDSEKYNEMFVQQLTELLTHYGTINEVWFDGANGEGPNGKVQVYDWDRFYKVIEKLQPDAVTAIMGDDIRWVGNERGLGRATEWSVTPLYPPINEKTKAERQRLNIKETAEDLGSRELIAEAKAVHWYPSEVDVSIRPGWFYHASQDNQVKSLAQLVHIYNHSVGMNSVLLLNVPPNRRGLFADEDVARLKQFGEYIRKVYSDNKLRKEKIYWEAKLGEHKEWATDGSSINTILLQEDILKGQRVAAFKLEGWIDNQWKPLAEGTTIGYKRILTFPDCRPSKIRLTISNTRDTAFINGVGAYYAPEIKSDEHREKLNRLDRATWKTLQESPLILDLGKTVEAEKITYQPKKGEEAVFKYQLSLSQDGTTWKKLRPGEFSNIKNNPIPQTIHLGGKPTFRFIKLESLEGTDGGKPKVEAQQIGVL